MRSILVVLFFVCIALMLAWTVSSMTKEKPYYSHFVKASLVFREDLDASRGYPHALNAYLRLSNIVTLDVTMVIRTDNGIQAELLDADGKTVPEDAHIASSDLIYLPSRSNREWLLPNHLVNVDNNSNDSYALIVGSHGWLIPVKNVSSYSLRIRLRGDPSARSPLKNDDHNTKLFLDVPPTKIQLSK